MANSIDLRLSALENRNTETDTARAELSERLDNNPDAAYVTRAELRDVLATLGFELPELFPGDEEPDEDEPADDEPPAADPVLAELAAVELAKPVKGKGK